jgi:hypothetical protein
MKTILSFPILILFLSACTESSVDMISGPDLFNEHDFYITEVNEENRAELRDVEVIWKEATFGRLPDEPVFQNHHLMEVESEAGETTYWLTAVSSDNCIDIASKLEKTEAGFILGATNTGKICACIGCGEGCTLKIEDGKCACETYTPSDNECEKVEVVEIEQ